MNNASSSKKRKADEHPDTPEPKKQKATKKNRSQSSLGKKNGNAKAQYSIGSNKLAESPNDLIKNLYESKNRQRTSDYLCSYIEAYMNYYKEHGPKLISAELIDTFENYLKNFKQTSIPKKSDNENADKLAEEIRINLKNKNATELDIYLNLKDCIDKKQFSYNDNRRSTIRDTGRNRARSDAKKNLNLDESSFNTVISGLRYVDALYIFYFLDGYITYYSMHQKTMIDNAFQDKLASRNIPDWQVLLVNKLVEGEISTDSLQNEEKVSTPDQIIGEEDTIPTDDSEGENEVSTQVQSNNDLIFSLNSFGIFTTQLETTWTEPELEGLRETSNGCN